MSKELKAAYLQWWEASECKCDWAEGLDEWSLCSHTNPEAAFIAGAKHERERILKALRVDTFFIGDIERICRGESKQ